MSNDGGPAFPSHGTMGEVVQSGMSLRDWFAGQALLAMAARDDLNWEQTASECYYAADAMLAARDAK